MFRKLFIVGNDGATEENPSVCVFFSKNRGTSHLKAIFYTSQAKFISRFCVVCFVAAWVSRCACQSFVPNFEVTRTYVRVCCVLSVRVLNVQKCSGWLEKCCQPWTIYSATTLLTLILLHSVPSTNGSSTKFLARIVLFNSSLILCLSLSF